MLKITKNLLFKKLVKWKKYDIIEIMKMQQILGKVRKACELYDLIEENDKIAVGVSGGKDSLTLLTTLALMRRFYPKKYQVVAISIDLFGGVTDYSKIANYCNQLDVEFIVVPSDIKKIVFDIRKEQNPCSLCANLRRGILNNTAKQLGCNKVALGHHSDDLVETLLLSMFYESRFNTFLPKTHLTNQDLIVLRPLILLDEKDIVNISKDMPILKNNCPADHHTQRQYIKNLILNLNKDIFQVKQHILSAIMHPERTNLFPNISKKLDKNSKITNDTKYQK